MGSYEKEMHFRKLSFCQTQVLHYQYRDTWMTFSVFDRQVVRLLVLIFPSGLNPYEMEFIMSIGAFVPEWHVFIIVAQS